ncbi:MAG: aminopeptidase N [Gammaproteobacteria bacterium]|nr:aminopeptidase N [Gammaproteobacteria bacterium]
MSIPATPQTIYRKDYQPPAFLIDHIELTFDIHEDYTAVKSQLHCRRQTEQADLILNGENLELTSVFLDGQPCDSKTYAVTPQQLTLFNVPAQCVVSIEVKIRPQENTALSGLYRSRNYLCTQCEPEGFRRITYFPDRPDVMAKYTTTMIADKSQYPILLSNGNLVASGETPEGKHWVRWEDPYNKPSYLFALVAGDFDCLQDDFVTRGGRCVQLRIYVEKECLEQAHHAMRAVKKAMQWDEEIYGCEYDLDIYMIVAVSDFNMGAMENKGLNIFNDKYILASHETATDEDFLHVETVIAHEYFHNWTGNRITCRDWFQLSLKEGLTIFREQSFTEDTTSETVSRIDEVDYLRTIQFSEDNGPLAHSVRPESYIEINNFYTATVYNKGSEVIRMMRTLVGAETFQAGMDLYFERHDGQAVTIEDFVRVHEDASGKDLQQFRLWYSQAGTPRVQVEDYYDAEKKSYTLTFKQSCPPTPEQPTKYPFHIPIQMGLLENDGRELFNELVELREPEKTITLENIQSKPVPSLLRQFSAPVKLEYDYSDAALALLFKHDTDYFNRREAGVRYASRIVFQLMNNAISIVPAIYLEACRSTFQTMQHDRWLLSRMLTIPSERYLAEQMKVVDVDGIHSAREVLLKAIATHLRDDLLASYQELQSKASQNQFDMHIIADRSLKNFSLGYLMLLEESGIHEIALQQFQTALGHQMTDTMAALKALINVPHLRDEVLKAFYDRWHDHALIVDKWLALQASSKLPDTLDRIKQLFLHSAFDVRNPNKVYALIGTFGANPIVFHQGSGAGYQFLADVITQLDHINPQVAARMLKPLTDWKRYDLKRQVLMREALTRLTNASSPDIYEIVTKSLTTEEQYYG